MKTITNLIIATSLLTAFACKKEEEQNNHIEQNPLEVKSQEIKTVSCLKKALNIVLCAELSGTAEEVANDGCQSYKEGYHCSEMIQDSYPSSISFGNCNFSHTLNNQDANLYFSYTEEISYDSATSFVETIHNSCANGEYGSNGRFSYPDNLQEDTQDIEEQELPEEQSSAQEERDEDNEVNTDLPEPSQSDDGEEEVTVSCLKSGITFDSNYNTVNFLKCSQFTVSPDQVDVERTWCNYDPQAVFAEVGCEDRYTHQSTYFLGKCEGSYSTKFFYKTDGANLQRSKQAVKDNRCYLGSWTDGWI
jgi:hypothetical protein